MEINVHDFEGYVKNNPFMAYNHIELIEAGPDRSTVRLTIRPESQNLHGTVHGGLLYALADCVAGVTARADGTDYVTQSGHISFLGNVSSGTIFATGTTLRRGHRALFVHIDIRSESGEQLADGTVELSRMGRPMNQNAAHAES